MSEHDVYVSDADMVGMLEVEVDNLSGRIGELEASLEIAIGRANATHDALVEARAENDRLTEQRNTLLGALAATLPELGELENHWKNEAEAFDHPFEEAERRLSLSNLDATRRVIKRVRDAIKAATAART